MKIKLMYIGTTLPKKMYEVLENKVEGLMKTGEWEYYDKQDEKLADKKEEYKGEVIELKGIGTKTTEKIIKKYPTIEVLFNASHKELYDYLDDNDVKLLIEKGYVNKED